MAAGRLPPSFWARPPWANGAKLLHPVLPEGGGGKAMVRSEAKQCLEKLAAAHSRISAKISENPKGSWIANSLMPYGWSVGSIRTSTLSRTRSQSSSAPVT